MNSFEELCKLASRENWCWKLFCTTCGHMHFRYAFAELASGKSPNKSDWVIHNTNSNYSDSLSRLPRFFTDEQKQEIIAFCYTASLSSIAKACKFPDWLGYLGLVLEHMYLDKEQYRKLSETWASQLSELVHHGSTAQHRLAEIMNSRTLLTIKDLELCESNIRI